MVRSFLAPERALPEFESEEFHKLYDRPEAMMKASVKFREDGKPLVRAKIPVRILGLPFRSGVVAGNASELTLNVSTAFDSSTSLRLSYRLNDSANPFTLSLKAGSGSGPGPFGSPLASSFSLSAHFNLLHHRQDGTNPVFTLSFSPSLGDFSVKKKVQSLDVDSSLWRGKHVGEAKGVSSEDEDSSTKGGGFVGGGIGWLRDLGRNVVDMPASVTGLLSRMEVGARSAVPVMAGRAVVTFRWGVRVPVEPGGINSSKLDKFSFLVMNKIGIEQDYRRISEKSHKKGKEIDDGNKNSDCELDVAAEGWCLMRRQLDMLKEENGELRRVMDDLRHEFASRSGSLSAGYNGKGIEGDTNEEPKKVPKEAGADA